MKVLVLGGTAFLGRHITEAAAGRGHEITLFNRGKRNPELFPTLETLTGERDSDLAPLRNRAWDAVFDTCGYVPRIVEKTAKLFAEGGCHYTFISSISVYSSFDREGIDETAPTGVLNNPATETIDGETYGPLKAACERVVQTCMPDRSLCVRPGLIVGPHDYTGRFGYWPKRVAEGSEVLAPGSPESRLQFIDVRDLAEWIVTMAESRMSGAYNATGPERPVTMETLLTECRAVTGSNARFTWASAKFLLEQGVKPWQDLPLWIDSENNPDMRGFSAVSIEKALASGLRFRPLAETIRGALNTPQGIAGMARDRETELLGRIRATSPEERPLRH